MGAGCLRDHSRRFLDRLLRRSRRDQHYTDDCQHNHSREFSALDHILLVVNRNRLIINTEVFEANGTAERDAALVMLEQIPGKKQVTVGGDKAYDTADFVAECRILTRIIRELKDKRSLPCYKHVYETLFEALPEASSCLTIAQHSVYCSQEFFASL